MHDSVLFVEILRNSSYFEKSFPANTKINVMGRQVFPNVRNFAGKNFMKNCIPFLPEVLCEFVPGPIPPTPYPPIWPGVDKAGGWGVGEETGDRFPPPS